MTDAEISKAYREAFETHPARETDPALAEVSARETAAGMLPAGVTGFFDSETLTFCREDATAEVES